MTDIKSENAAKRSEQRITINHEFESYDAFINEYVTNISRSGVFIRSKNPLPVGTTVNLKFTVVTDEIESVEGVGKVTRIEENPAGMGVVFTRLPTYSKNLIERLLVKKQ
jgi:uncharacterized protein (TIGR02266 family)